MKWFDFKPKKTKARISSPVFLYKYRTPKGTMIQVTAKTKSSYKQELRFAMNAVRREYDKIIREERKLNGAKH